jgi:serine/threonine-protein kinase RsbW
MKSVPADGAELPELNRYLHTFWSAAGLPPAAVFPFELALEEVFVNVVTHGTPAGGPVPQVDVALEHSGDFVILTVEDDGLPFDPLSVPDPDVEAPIEARAVGGLGIFLVRELMDDVSYSRAGGRNHLRMSKRIE